MTNNDRSQTVELVDQEAAAGAPSASASAISRDDAIRAIRQGLKARSGKSWSVTGGRGTGWGWITITAPPRRREGGALSEADRAELGDLLGLGRTVHHQGETIPGGSDHYREFAARANGSEPGIINAVELPASAAEA